MSNKAFNPNEHLIQLKSKNGSQDYLPVQWRLVWFRESCPNGTIDTEEIVVDLDREVESEAFVWNQEKRRSEKVIKQARGYARFRAIVTDGKGGRATGYGSESAADFNDYVEKAETKAIGRALAALGYGTQFAPEMNEEHRIVDAPVVSQETIDVDQLKQDWATAYRIADNEVSARWPKYLVHVLGSSPADLTPQQKQQIKAKIAEQSDKQQKAS